MSSCINHNEECPRCHDTAVTSETYTNGEYWMLCNNCGFYELVEFQRNRKGEALRSPDGRYRMCLYRPVTTGILHVGSGRCGASYILNNEFDLEATIDALKRDPEVLNYRIHQWDGQKVAVLDRKPAEES